MLFISGYLFSYEKNIIKIIFLIVILHYSFLYIANYKTVYIQNLKKEQKEKLYISDKISVFYLSQNKSAIIPYDTDITQMIALYDPELKIKKITQTSKNQAYLYYISQVYNINIAKGFDIILVPREQAIKTFFKNGGVITEEELKNIKFSNILKLNNKLIYQIKYKTL